MISDRELWQRARPLFDELVEVDAAARIDRLATIGATDPQLRDAVEWLLAADANADAALRDYHFGTPRETPAATTASTDPLGLMGRTVSHFRVTGYLAAGGMGADTARPPLGRTCALKSPVPQPSMPWRERRTSRTRRRTRPPHSVRCTRSARASTACFSPCRCIPARP